MASSTSDTISNIIKDLAEVLKGVPYVERVATTVLYIIKIRNVRNPCAFMFLRCATHRCAQEVKVNKNRCAQLVKIVEDHVITLLRSLEKLSRSPQRDQLKDLEDDLLRYAMYVMYFGSKSLVPYQLLKASRSDQGQAVSVYTGKVAILGESWKCGKRSAELRNRPKCVPPRLYRACKIMIEASRE
jgi:hypothetical protein